MQPIAPAPAPQSVQPQDMNADADLRAQLAAVINHGPGPHGYTDVPASTSASPHERSIDPSIGGAQGGAGDMMSAGAAAGDSGGEDSMGDIRKGGKRELSQSKRAAQNRAAQRAFRQRKEGYIKKLEEQVREFHSLEDNFKAIQAENYSLREYIIHLQSRLIESQGDYPQPPPNINLTHPHARHEHAQHQQQKPQQHVQRHDPAPVAPMAPMSQLQASAARTLAAASLNESTKDHGFDHSKRYKEDQGENSAVDDGTIRSQLQATTHSLPNM